MPRNALTKQLEVFCQGVAEGLTGTKAALSAGYKSTSAASQASQILKRPAVQARIAELKTQFAAQAAVQAGTSKQAIVANLQRIAAEAETAKRYGDAIRANELIGKEIGMFVERKDISLRSLKDLSDDELRALMVEAQQAADSIH